MRLPSLLLGALAIPASLLPAQSPCGSPNGVFTTLFAGTTFLGTPDPVVGANMFFDLAVNADVTISQIDVNLLDNGTATVGGVLLPNLIGQTTQLIVHTTPTTWVGQNANPGVWTAVATGTLTVADTNNPSVAVFSPPFTLTAGTYGIALQHMPVTTGPTPGAIHPLYTNPAARPGTPTVISDQFITLTAGAGQAIAFTSGVAQPRVVNTNITYSVNSNAARYSAYGSGCYNNPQSFYENFTVPPATFDLSNSGFTMINTGASFTVVPGAGPIVAPTSPSLTLNPPATTATASWDDALSGPQTLPFNFPFPGGSTNQVDIGSNGYLFLLPSTSTAPFYNGVAGLMADAPRIAPYWGDLDPDPAVPGTTATLHFETTANNATITWWQVPEWNVSTTVSTIQIVLDSSGLVEVRYGSCGISVAPVLVGWSPGGGVADPGSVDISTSLPLVTGDGSLPPVLGIDARPVLGTAPNLVVSDIRSGSLAGIRALSLGTVFPGIDLGALGMPGCRQFVTLPAVNTVFLVTGPTATLPLSIPNNPGLAGLVVTGQTAIISSGLNAAGIIVSNGLCLTLGGL